MRSVVITIFAIAGIVLASNANTSVVDNKMESNASKINVNNIKLEFKELKSYSNIPGTRDSIPGRDSYTTLLMKTDKTSGKSSFFGLVNDGYDHYDKLTILSDTDERFDMSVQYVIQPIKNEDFYILFSSIQQNKVIIYNASTGYKIDLKGGLVSVKDYDNDGVQEVVTAYRENSSKYTVEMYKIINPDTEPTVTPLLENKLQVKGSPPEIEIYKRKRHPSLKYGAKFIYYPDDGFLLVDQENPYEKKTYRTKSLNKAYRAFNKHFNKNSEFTYKTNETARRNAYRGISVINTENWSNLEKAKLDRMKLNLCTILPEKLYANKLKVHLCSQRTDSQTRNKPLKLKSFKASDGTLIISDSNLFNDFNINIAKKEINGNIISAVGNNNFIVLSNIQSKKSMYYSWKHLLGYQPKYVKYFDFNYLVAVKKENEKEYIKVYKVNINTSDATQELW